MRSALTFATILFASTLLVSAQTSEEPGPPKPEQYAATAFITSGPAQGKSVGVTIYINSYTTDQEVQNFLNILKTKGQDGLEKKGELELENYGQTPVRLANVRREK